MQRNKNFFVISKSFACFSAGTKEIFRRHAIVRAKNVGFHSISAEETTNRILSAIRDRF